MKTTVDVYDMKAKFVALDRDYYTFAGLEALLDYYDQVDENMEFDPIAICCDCTEYGDGAACSFDDLVNDYGYLYPSEELEDNGAELDKYTQREKERFAISDEAVDPVQVSKRSIYFSFGARFTE